MRVVDSLGGFDIAINIDTSISLKDNIHLQSLQSFFERGFVVLVQIRLGSNLCMEEVEGEQHVGQ
jgi:hypothetical protein